MTAAAPPIAPLEALNDLDATYLPTGQMRQITRITLLDGARIEGEVALDGGHWVFPQHFPGDPIFPGTLMIEAAGQLVALWAWARGRRGRPRLLSAKAQFHQPVRPAAERLEVAAEVLTRRGFHFGETTIHAGGIRVATVEVVLAVLDQ